MAKITVIPQKINPITKLPNNAIKKIRVAAYARVSTKQEDQANSYEAQIKYYTELINSHPDWEFAGMYADKGITGTSRKHRVEFNKMIEDALNGKIDKIILKSVTRFARNTLDTVGLARELKNKGVEIFFEENNISNFDPNGELNLTINASIAQEESRNISQNVRWGKHKKYREGITSVAYSNFLGYDKHPTDPKIGFQINEAEAKLIRLIYKEYMKGKSTHNIAKLLESLNIKTPTGKDKWNVGTIERILTNEKYKGDAHIVKKYVKDFLTHELVPNNGEVESFYVEGHHEPIINPEEWELVQNEMRRRKKLGVTYSNTGTFSSKLICADCGGFYGKKIWHSTDAYRKEVYRCNNKYKNKEKCQTPSLTEEEIKDKFLKAYSILMSDRKNVIEDCELVIETLCNTSSINEEIAKYKNQANDIVVLVENLLAKNASVALNQDEFIKKYNEYDKLHKDILKKVETLEIKKSEIIAKEKLLMAFVEEIKNRPLILEEWSDDIWFYLIDRAIVNKDCSIKFIFKNGKEVIV